MTDLAAPQSRLYVHRYIVSRVHLTSTGIDRPEAPSRYVPGFLLGSFSHTKAAAADPTRFRVAILSVFRDSPVKSIATVAGVTRDGRSTDLTALAYSRQYCDGLLISRSPDVLQSYRRHKHHRRHISKAECDIFSTGA